MPKTTYEQKLVYVMLLGKSRSNVSSRNHFISAKKNKMFQKFASQNLISYL